jgi:hypothetical protein
MELTMMDPAERHRKLARLSAANGAWLRSQEAKRVFVAKAAQFHRVEPLRSIDPHSCAS